MMLITEFGIILLFLITIYYILKRDKKEIYLIILAAIYAALFENVNILLSEDQSGSYYYNNTFTFNLFHVPLFVVLSWAIIIYSSKKIAENLPIKSYSIIFAASILVLIVDLSIDIVAIRLFYWFWNDYKFNEGFFGVPANNYIGWLLISFVFYACFEFFKKKKINIFGKSLLILSASYLIFLLFFITINSINNITELNKTQQFIPLFLLLIIFSFFIRFEKKNSKSHVFPFLIRMPFYLFGFVNVLINSMYKESIIILALTILFILFELLLFLLVWYNEHKRKIKNGDSENTEKNRLFTR